MNSWKLPGSANAAMRSRTLSLPCRRCRAAPSGPPMASAICRRRCSSSISFAQDIRFSAPWPGSHAGQIVPTKSSPDLTGRGAGLRFRRITSTPISVQPGRAPILDAHGGVRNRRVHAPRPRFDRGLPRPALTLPPRGNIVPQVRCSTPPRSSPPPAVPRSLPPHIPRPTGSCGCVPRSPAPPPPVPSPTRSA